MVETQDRATVAADPVSRSHEQPQPSKTPGIIAGVIALLLFMGLPIAVALVVHSGEPMRRQTVESLNALIIGAKVIAVIMALVLVCGSRSLPGRVFGWIILGWLAFQLFFAWFMSQ